MHGYSGINISLFFLSLSYGIDDSVVTYTSTCIWNRIAGDTFPHFPMSKELDTLMSKSRLIPSAPFLRLGAQETRFGWIVNTLVITSVLFVKIGIVSSSKPQE